MNYKPKLSNEVNELFSLARVDVDLTKSVCEILDRGTPLVRADVDSCPTNSTADRVFTYHLSEPMKVLLATARARYVDPVYVPVGDGLVHLSILRPKEAL